MSIDVQDVIIFDVDINCNECDTPLKITDIQFDLGNKQLTAFVKECEVCNK